MPLAPQGEQWGDKIRGLCIWEGDTRLGLGVLTENDPLAWAYRNSNMMKVFEPTTVEGQPAVYTAAHLPRTGCDLKVGIAPNQGLDLSYSGKDSTVDWCGQVIEIAKIMVRRIRARAAHSQPDTDPVTGATGRRRSSAGVRRGPRRGRRG